jgi:hypothetical protein
MAEGDPNQEISWVTRKFGFLAAVCTSPILILFIYIGDERRGSTAWFSAIMISIVIRTFWRLRNRVWFWITIGFIVLLHVALIILVPWPFKQLSYVALLPIGILDVFIAYGILRLMERVIERNAALKRSTT